MRPTRVLDLPVHRGGHRKGPGATKKLQHAFEAGLGMAGLAPTKAGSDDKERAYVVRQNSLLRWALVLVLMFLVLSGVAMTTFLEVKIARKQSIKAEVKHHTEFHTSQVKLMRVHLALQQALKDEVHETSRVEEFKAFLERSLGDHITKIESWLSKSSVEKAILGRIVKENERLRKQEVAKITSLIHRFQVQSNSARNSMKKIAKQIIQDVESDAKESDEFVAAMAKLGKNSEDYMVETTIERQPGDVIHEDDDDYDEAQVEEDLHNFFKILDQHQFPDVKPQVVEKWSQFLEQVLKTLDRDDKETDLVALQTQIERMLIKDAPNLPRFDRKKHGSVVDYLEVIVEEARIFPFKQQLMDLYQGWKTDKKTISPYTVLSGVERIAEDNDLYLLLEWLEGKEPDEEDDDDYGGVELEDKEDDENALLGGAPIEREPPAAAAQEKRRLEKTTNEAQEKVQNDQDPKQQDEQPQEQVHQ